MRSTPLFTTTLLLAACAAPFEERVRRTQYESPPEEWPSQEMLDEARADTTNTKLPFLADYCEHHDEFSPRCVETMRAEQHRQHLLHPEPEAQHRARLVELEQRNAALANQIASDSLRDTPEDFSSALDERAAFLRTLEEEIDESADIQRAQRERVRLLEQRIAADIRAMGERPCSDAATEAESKMYAAIFPSPDARKMFDAPFAEASKRYQATCAPILAARQAAEVERARRMIADPNVAPPDALAAARAEGIASEAVPVVRRWLSSKPAHPVAALQAAMELGLVEEAKAYARGVVSDPSASPTDKYGAAFAAHFPDDEIRALQRAAIDDAVARLSLVDALSLTGNDRDLERTTRDRVEDAVNAAWQRVVTEAAKDQERHPALSVVARIAGRSAFVHDLPPPPPSVRKWQNAAESRFGLLSVDCFLVSARGMAAHGLTCVQKTMHLHGGVVSKDSYTHDVVTTYRGSNGALVNNIATVKDTVTTMSGDHTLNYYEISGDTAVFEFGDRRYVEKIRTPRYETDPEAQPAAAEALRRVREEERERLRGEAERAKDPGDAAELWARVCLLGVTVDPKAVAAVRAYLRIPDSLPLDLAGPQ